MSYNTEFLDGVSPCGTNARFNWIEYIFLFVNEIISNQHKLAFIVINHNNQIQSS